MFGIINRYLLKVGLVLYRERRYGFTVPVLRTLNTHAADLAEADKISITVRSPDGSLEVIEGMSFAEFREWLAHEEEE